MIRVGAAIEHHDDQFVGGRIVIYLLEIIRMARTWTDEHDESQCRRQRQCRCPTRGSFSHRLGARCCAVLDAVRYSMLCYIKLRLAALDINAFWSGLRGAQLKIIYRPPFAWFARSARPVATRFTPERLDHRLA